MEGERKPVGDEGSKIPQKKDDSSKPMAQHQNEFPQEVKEKGIEKTEKAKAALGMSGQTDEYASDPVETAKDLVGNLSKLGNPST